MSKHFFKSTLAVSVMTLISRLLGFVRDMLIARFFGVDLATDAFFVAFKIPNFLRRLFTEGAVAHAFMPVLEDYKRQSSQAGLKRFLDKAAGTLALVLMLITLLGIVIAPLLIFLLAPGFAWQGGQHNLAVQLLQITLPYLLCIGLVALAGSVLNSYGQFVIPALTPALLNLSMIAATIWLAPLFDTPVTALAWGVFIAGLVQVSCQLPALLRLGLMPRLRVDFGDNGVSRFMRQLLPAIFSVSVTQVNLLLDTLIASLLAAGSVSWLYYSERLVEFPQGLLGVAAATVILPRLAKNHAEDDPCAFSNGLDWGLRLVLLVGMPATVGLLLLAEPILSTLFQYHEFSPLDVQFAGRSLKAYAVGLLGYLFVRVLVPGFTARQDMKTPVRYGIYAMLASLALNVLAFPLAHAGLALATSLGALLNAGLLLKKLRQKQVYRPVEGWRLFFLQVMLASAAMSAVLYHFVDVAEWNRWHSVERLVNLLVWVLVGITVYVSTLLLSGLKLRHLAMRA
ncbi:MAG: murein biosynthesis integral membrane protein MurJ [Methylovulum sp.]|nr:murein biosynthesis integral membrane protein MurJ [Methylovulum sp.]